MRTASQTILAIETSCDETAVAIVRCSGDITTPRFKILGSALTSQIDMHAEFGGVVPNIAKREHIKNLPIVLRGALKKAGIENPEREIDYVAVTRGPGLEPALWTGINFAIELARTWGKKLIAANHMEGHILAAFLDDRKSSSTKNVRFPALALLVSGGHTELVLMKEWGTYSIIGKTLDDAAGEAFDKVARMMKLGYPGGPAISALARAGNRNAFAFPRPMLHAKNYNFSFSGLKTAVLYALRELEEKNIPYSKEDVAASFEEAVVETLVSKTVRAIDEFGVRSIIIGGGVAANSYLKKRLRARIRASKARPTLHMPLARLTTDNAAMIAAASYLRSLKGEFANWKKLKAHATLEL